MSFQFGSDKEKPSTIYNKDFDTGVQQDTAQTGKHAPPPSSEVSSIKLGYPKREVNDANVVKWWIYESAVSATADMGPSKKLFSGRPPK